MGYGSVINVFGSIADLDQIPDGMTYRKVVSVNEFGQITQASISPEVSFSASLSDGAVQSNHIASGAVNGGHIADGSIQSNHIASATVQGGHIAEAQIQSNHIASGAVVGWHIPDSTILTNHLATSAVTSDKTTGWSGSFYVDGTQYNVSNGLITGTGM